MVDSIAYNGSLTKNPFDFNTFKSNLVATYIDGDSCPGRPLRPSFGDSPYTSNYIESYQTIFSETGKVLQDDGLIISREDYMGGYYITVFDFNSMSNHIKRGNLRLELQFAESLPSPITVLAYIEYPDFFKVDQARNILFH